MQETERRAAFVSGAASGIGRAVTRMLAADGTAVVAFDRDADGLNGLARELRALGRECLTCVGDVRSAADVEDAFDRGTARFGPLHLSVANAAVGDPCPLEQLDDERFATFIDTNLGGVFRVCRAAGLRMRAAGGGSIVTVGSALGVVGLPKFTAYSASKGGVIALTRALAAELAPVVRVNCVCPGVTDTAMTTLQFAGAEDPSSARLSAADRIPLARFASPDDIAAAIVWLGSDRAAYSTGSIVMVDGGISAI